MEHLSEEERSQKRFENYLEVIAEDLSQSFIGREDEAAGLLSSIGHQIYTDLAPIVRTVVYPNHDMTKIYDELFNIASIARDYNGKSIEALKLFDKRLMDGISRKLPRFTSNSLENIGSNYDRARKVLEIVPELPLLEKIILEQDPLGSVRSPGSGGNHSGNHGHRSPGQQAKLGPVALEGFTESGQTWKQPAYG